MKIKETIERECCQAADMKPYRGLVGRGLSLCNPRVCVHCGQVWFTVREMGPAGSTEPIQVKGVVEMPK